MASTPSYCANAEYLVAAIVYLATCEHWWARTPTNLAKELSLDERKLREMLDNFPGIFRRSRFTVEGTTEHTYSLQARYALKPKFSKEDGEDYKRFEVGADGRVSTLPIDTLDLLLSFVTRSVASERAHSIRSPSNWIPILAAVVAASAAVAAAVLSK